MEQHSLAKSPSKLGIRKELISQQLSWLMPSVAIVIALFYPTSRNQEIFRSKDIAIYYLVILSILLIIIMLNTLSSKQVILSVSILLYLVLATVLCASVTGAEYSLPRFSVVIFCILVLNTKIRYTPPVKKMVTILEILTQVIIIWNSLVILNSNEIIALTLNNYSQFNSFTVAYAISTGRPVFTFGVHTFASFFYMIIFFLWYATLKNRNTRNKRYYLYLIAMIAMTVLLRSSSSFVFALFMIILLFDAIRKPMIVIFLILAITTIIAHFPENNLFKEYYYMITSSYNGIIPRYISRDSLFSGNFKVIKETFLGIGFTIPREYALSYTDSGYIVYFTMGNIFLPLGLGALLFNYLKANVPKYSLAIFFIVLVFEIAIPSIMYPKTLLVITFATFYLHSLASNPIPQLANNV